MVTVYEMPELLTRIKIKAEMGKHDLEDTINLVECIEGLLWKINSLSKTLDRGARYDG
jgi:hypothetical protein